jgi:Integrase core domain
LGTALDNALMESQIGLYWTELISKRGPGKNLAQVELATAEYVEWFNSSWHPPRSGMSRPLNTKPLLSSNSAVTGS